MNDECPFCHANSMPKWSTHPMSTERARRCQACGHIEDKPRQARRVGDVSETAEEA
jgi:MoaA/NifB/PqqE/SkfB family radical SAM enzyme